MRKVFLQIENLIHNLEADAVFDGVYSTDEKKLLIQIMDDTSGFDDLIHHILEDDEVTEEEISKMRTYKTRIKYNAEHLAGMDGVISSDEEKLLMSLTKFVDELPY